MKNLNSKIFCFLLLSLFTVELLSSCEDKVLNKEKLIAYIGHNKDLNKSEIVNAIKISVRFIPYQLIALQDMQGSHENNHKTFEEINKKLRRYYYFRLSFSKKNEEVLRQLGSFREYSEMVQKMSFDMGSYINALNDKNDTISLADYSFENNYGMSAENNMLIVFNKEKFKKSKHVDLKIGEFGLRTGTLSFVFRKEDLENVPDLRDYLEIERSQPK